MKQHALTTHFKDGRKRLAQNEPLADSPDPACQDPSEAHGLDYRSRAGNHLNRPRQPIWVQSKSGDFEIDNELALSRIPDWKLLWIEIPMFTFMTSRWNTKRKQYFVVSVLRINNPLIWIPFLIPLLVVKTILKVTIFNHFCGGESIKGCRKRMNKLMDDGISSILDFAKETGNENSYDETVDEVLNTIYEAEYNQNISFAVFKLTGIADKQVLEKVSNGTASEEDSRKFEEARTRVDRLCNAAALRKMKILIDAEDSWIQPAIDLLAEEMMVRYNRGEFTIYNTVQLYRTDRLDYMKTLHSRLKAQGIKTAIKLVRGAYMEQENARALDMGYISPIHTTKERTDQDYNEALKYALENLDSMAILAGTNNPESTRLLTRLMTDHKIDKNDSRIYFAQLLGMSDNISYNLASCGYNVGKYMPYAKMKDALPYLSRRANENKSVLGEMSRELSMRKNELDRRRKRNEKLYTYNSWPHPM